MHALSRVIMLVAAIIVVAPVRSAAADDLACVSTTFRFIGANDKVCVSAFDDPKVEGIACHISQARTGGVKGSLGLAEDPSRFSIACRQVGPITADLAKLPEDTPPALSVLQAHPDLPDWTRSGTRLFTLRSATKSSRAHPRTRYPPSR